MNGPEHEPPLSFLDRRSSAAFEISQLIILPGSQAEFGAGAWQGSLVVVEQGEIEVEGMHGTHRCFGAGAVVCLEGIAIRALRNRGSVVTVLSKVTRRRRLD